MANQSAKSAKNAVFFFNKDGLIGGPGSISISTVMLFFFNQDGLIGGPGSISMSIMMLFFFFNKDGFIAILHHSGLPTLKFLLAPSYAAAAHYFV